MALKETKLELGLAGLEGLAKNYYEISKLVKEQTGSDSLTRSGLQIQVNEDVTDIICRCYAVIAKDLPSEYPYLRTLACKMYNELQGVLVVK